MVVTAIAEESVLLSTSTWPTKEFGEASSATWRSGAAGPKLRPKRVHWRRPVRSTPLPKAARTRAMMEMSVTAWTAMKST
jgi:hypothetical protein